MGAENIRILIISNNALNNANSNGRTLINLLKGVKPENIAQFYISGTIDETVCSKFYQVSDKDALNAFLGKKPIVKSKAVDEKPNELNGKKVDRNCRNLVFRNWVWKSYLWWKKDFTEFIENFKPNVILFQAGDSPFMYAIARKISKKYNLPIIMYNSENYVLKKYMFASVKKPNFWHWLLKRALKIEYKKMMRTVSYCVYITEYLESLYQQAYPHKDKSITLYTATEMQDCNKGVANDNFTLLYCGNLGVGRIYPLNEIAQTLYEINSNYKLTVCGQFVSEDDKTLLLSNSNVNYLGVIPYTEVSNKIAECSMVIHTENIERLENLKGAFSTKIADCLACGKPFLVYASSEYPFVKYLIDNKVAHIAENKEQLKEVIVKCTEDKEYLNQYFSNAKNLALKNHNAIENSKRLVEIINNILNSNNE